MINENHENGKESVDRLYFQLIVQRLTRKAVNAHHSSELRPVS